jgi:hypothetical protein
MDPRQIYDRADGRPQNREFLEFVRFMNAQIKAFSQGAAFPTEAFHAFQKIFGESPHYQDFLACWELLAACYVAVPGAAGFWAKTTAEIEQEIETKIARD